MTTTDNAVDKRKRERRLFLGAWQHKKRRIVNKAMFAMSA